MNFTRNFVPTLLLNISIIKVLKLGVGDDFIKKIEKLTDWEF